MPDNQAVAQPEAAPVEIPTVTLAYHRRVMEAMDNGELTLEQYRAAFHGTVASREALRAELSAMTKKQLLENLDPMTQARYRNDKKDDIVDAKLRKLLTGFNLGDSVMIAMTDRDIFVSYQRAIEQKVAATTEEDLRAYAKLVADRRAAFVARREAMVSAVNDPQTLEDFQTFIRVRGESELSPEQMVRYDELQANDSLQKLREAQERVRAVRSNVSAAGELVGVKVIDAKHTKNGYDITVVQLERKVDRDVYEQLNAAAKKLGGYYSSYRGNGAIPGFTFRDKSLAQAFALLAGEGNTQVASEVARERRDAFEDDKSQSSVDRLRSMADRLEQSANESLGADRKTNTARRAAMASAAEREANSQIALAKTMRNIAQAIEEGSATFLAELRTKTQVDLFSRYLKRAHYDYARHQAKLANGDKPGYDEDTYRDALDGPIAELSASFVTYPSYRIHMSDIAALGRELSEIDGAKQLGAALLKKSDDISKDYLAFVKENLLTVSLQKSGGGIALFSSREDAEVARRRSPGRQKMAVVSLGRGKNYVVVAPKEAIARGLWKGPEDKQITIKGEVALEIMEKVNGHNKRASKSDRTIRYPQSFDSVKADRQRLNAMGIVNSPMLRTAMREYIRLQAEAPKLDRVRELMRALVGNKGVGIDFFPTAKSVAASVVEMADIEPGMDVLEPEAGYGAIADEIRELGVEPDVCEISSTLREILDAKGYNMVGHDFLELAGKKYDRIVMNPPFSNGLDIEHVHHAYSLLKPGGRIVAIMSESSFYRTDRKAEAFRSWMDELDGTSERLPEGSFLDPSLPQTTGVNARVVVIDHELPAQENAVVNAAGGEPEAQADAVAQASSDAPAAPAMVAAAEPDYESFTGFPSM